MSSCVNVGEQKKLCVWKILAGSRVSSASERRSYVPEGYPTL